MSLLYLCRLAHHLFPLCLSPHHIQRSSQPIDLTPTTQFLLLLQSNLLHPFSCFRPSFPASPSILEIVDTTHRLSNMTSSSLHKYRIGLASLIPPLNRLITFIMDHQHKRDFFLNLPDYVCVHRLPNLSGPNCAGNADADFFPLSTSSPQLLSFQLFGILQRDGSVQGPIF